MELIKPPRLHPGDTVAAITLSWGGASQFPQRYEIGIARLKKYFGLNVIPTKHALRDPAWISQNPKARADDLMNAFANPKINAIFSIIGGDDALKLLPYIDYNIIQQNPKIFLGYSDSTTIHFMCLKAGLGSMYGPAILTQFAENVRMHSYTLTNLEKTLFDPEPIGILPANNDGWTAEFLDWDTEENQHKLRTLQPTLPWRFIGDSSVIKGLLIGGCFETLKNINHTELWPSLDTWRGSILFLETCGEGVDDSPKSVANFFRNLAAKNILSVINGILFGRPGGVTTINHIAAYDEAILQVLREQNLAHIPLVTRMDFGHTDPMLILPYGRLAQINVKACTVQILESAVE